MRYLLLVLISLVAKVANWFLAPLAVLFASEEGWLPPWLSWLQTPDNSLDGDEGWKTLHRPYKIDGAGWKRWVNRTAWLYRNSMYGFGEDVLGVTIQTVFIYECIGDEAVSNRPLHNGLVRRRILTNGNIVWQWYYVRAWSATRCIRLNFGWKLWGEHYPGRKVAFVFSANPFMGYS